VDVVEQQAHLDRRESDQRVDDVPRPRAGSGAILCGQTGEQGPGQQSRILVSGLAVDPHVDPARCQQVRPERLGEHRRLAESRPRDHQRHRVFPPLCEELDEPQAWHLDIERTWRERKGCRPVAGTWLVDRLRRLGRVHAGKESPQGVQIPLRPARTPRP
jgi:hypothetical protein